MCPNQHPQGGTVTLVFVHSPEEDGEPAATGSRWRPGAASNLWLRGALASLSADLAARYGAGAEVVLKRGPYLQALQEVRRGGAGRGCEKGKELWCGMGHSLRNAPGAPNRI
jgi:hypothetical protein